MTPDDVLILAWLVLAHLVADFLLQTDGVVADKLGDGRRAMRGLTVHGAGVALCLTPFAAAFGARGLALLVVVTAGHVVIDWWKTRATRAAEARAEGGGARGREGDSETPEALGAGWTPLPAVLFLLDQVFHAVLIGAAWFVFLARAEPAPEWTALVERAVGGLPQTEVHRVALLAAVLGSLLIVNVRAGAFFVATLVRPRGEGSERAIAPVEPPPPEAELPAAWRLRLGPLEAIAQPSRVPRSPVAPVVAQRAVGHASPVRIGATIGVLERLLIVIFVLSGAVAAIGFVVAAKTLARFKQLDDRDFAEYYLLGTLASVAIGLASALLAQAVLATLPAS